MKDWYQKNILPKLLNSTMSAQKFDAIRHSVIERAEGTVLEIGVGAGHNIPLYKNIEKLHALEPSRELLEIAKTKSAERNVNFINATAEKIPLPNNSIDTAVSTWTLCSVNDPKQVLTEIARVLKPGGKFVFVDHGTSPTRFIRAIQNLMTPLTKSFTGNCHLNRDIEDLLQNSGFKTKELMHPKESFKPLIYNYQGVAIVERDLINN